MVSVYVSKDYSEDFDDLKAIADIEQEKFSTKICEAVRLFLKVEYGK